MMECVVLDNGSSSIKVGFSGEDQPCAVVSLNSHKNNGGATSAALSSTTAFTENGGKGRKASIRQNGKNNLDMSARALADVKMPIKNGYISDWDAMQSVWDYTFEHELNIEPENFPVLLTDAPLNSKASRETMAQVMFENYSVPGTYIVSKAVLSLFATGRTRGVVLGLGAGLTSVTPIFEGFSLPHATKTVNFAGEDLTDMLQRMIGNNALPRSIVQDIKETVCSVQKKDAMNSKPPLFNGGSVKLKKSSMTNLNTPAVRRGSMMAASASRKESSSEDRRMEQDPTDSVTYELPDGQIVDVSKQCQHMVPEALFDPSTAGNHDITVGGVSNLTFQTVTACDKTLQSDLFSNIVIAGGTSMFPGFAQRLEADITAYSLASKVQVIPDSQRKFASWIGGSMFGSLDTFRDVQITKAEWEENGARIVHQKCL